MDRKFDIFKPVRFRRFWSQDQQDRHRIRWKCTFLRIAPSRDDQLAGSPQSERRVPLNLERGPFKGSPLRQIR